MKRRDSFKTLAALFGAVAVLPKVLAKEKEGTPVFNIEKLKARRDELLSYTNMGDLYILRPELVTGGNGAFDLQFKEAQKFVLPGDCIACFNPVTWEWTGQKYLVCGVFRGVYPLVTVKAFDSSTGAPKHLAFYIFCHSMPI